MQLTFKKNVDTAQSGADKLSAEAPNGLTRKVLFVIDTLETGGAERSLLENLSRFRSIEAHVCHIYSGDALKKKFVENGIPVHSLGIQSKYGFLKGFVALRQLVLKIRPDALVACLTRSEIISRCVARSLNITVIGTFVSDLYDPAYNAKMSWKAMLGVSIFRRLNQFTARFCSGFIANSEATRISNSKYLKISQDRIIVINRGRDSNKFAYRPNKLFSTAPVRFLNIGRLVPVKAQCELIIAFSRFLKNNDGAQLHIYGSGKCHASLAQLIADSGLSSSVFLRGTTDNIPQVMQNFDCLVFPSLSEGFSGTLVEAMFAGLPILASDIAANKEIITHMSTGYLFKSASTDAIHDAMLWFRNNRYAAYLNAATAHQVAKDKFDLDNISASLEAYISKTVSRVN